MTLPAESSDNGASHTDLCPVDIHSARLGDRPHDPGDPWLSRLILCRGLVNCHVFSLPLVRRGRGRTGSPLAVGY